MNNIIIFKIYKNEHDIYQLCRGIFLEDKNCGDEPFNEYYNYWKVLSRSSDKSSAWKSFIKWSNMLNQVIVGIKKDGDITYIKCCEHK